MLGFVSVEVIGLGAAAIKQIYLLDRRGILHRSAEDVDVDRGVEISSGTAKIFEQQCGLLAERRAVSAKAENCQVVRV